MVVHALGEVLCSAGAIVAPLLLLLLSVGLLGSGLGRGRRATAKHATDGVADGGAHCDTTAIVVLVPMGPKCPVARVGRGVEGDSRSSAGHLPEQAGALGALGRGSRRRTVRRLGGRVGGSRSGLLLGRLLRRDGGPGGRRAGGGSLARHPGGRMEG